MTEAYVAGLARAVPMALCLPLPSVGARLALALVLVGAGLPTIDAHSSARLPAELILGVTLGLLVAAPVWAARWAGALVGGAIVPRQQLEAPGLLFATLAWITFGASGGFTALLEAYLGAHAYAPAPDALVHAGAGLLALGCRLAVPALLALAILELGVVVIARFEESAGLSLGVAQLGRGARPVIAMLLVAASLAAIGHGVGDATRALSQ